MTQSTTYNDDGNYPALNMIYPPDIDQTSENAVSIDVYISAPTYKITVQKLTASGNNDGSAVEHTFTSTPMTIDGLQSGSIYSFTVQCVDGTKHGESQTIKKFTMDTTSFNGTIVGKGQDPKALSADKSYFSLTNSGLVKNQYALAYKAFDVISPQTGITYPNPDQSIKKLLPVFTATKCYSFGTSIFMDSNLATPNQAGGIGFFLNDNNTSGYFVIVETTTSSTAQDKKSIRIMKVNSKGLLTLADSQRDSGSTFEGVYGGTAYNIDVKVKTYSDSVEIRASINGFSITATDKNNVPLLDETVQNKKKPNGVLIPTKKISLIALKGTIIFDYIYASNMTVDDYANSQYITNMYQGQFSNDTLDLSFGDMTYNNNNSDADTTYLKSSVEEFGTVAREIVHVTPKFDARPAFPIKWSTGVNKFAKIIGQKYSNFNGEAFILNNTSTTVALSDGLEASLYVFGNQLGQSGVLEYSTDETKDYQVKEPIIFETKWLQNETDVKNLANWIKEKVVNRGKTINMTIFANPLISVGDIVSIKYIYQGLQGTEKFIITSVSHTYDQGMSTTITCRSL